MSTHIDRARRLLIPVGLLAVMAAPIQAQGTTTTTTDTAITAPVQQEEDNDFPWGLLGLLGLAGLLKRPKTEVVREPVIRDTTTTARPGDPNYRM